MGSHVVDIISGCEAAVEGKGVAPHDMIEGAVVNAWRLPVCWLVL